MVLLLILHVRFKIWSDIILRKIALSGVHFLQDGFHIHMIHEIFYFII